MSTAKRIALVPYEPGQEPEGMVSSLDPGDYEDSGHGKTLPLQWKHLDRIAAAVRAAKRDPWQEFIESLWPGERGLVELLREWSSFADCDCESCDECSPDALHERTVAVLRAMGAPADEPERSHRPPNGALHGEYDRPEPDFLDEVVEESTALDPEFPDKVSAAMAQLQPERDEDVPSAEERNRRQRAGLCRLCGEDRGGNSFWCDSCDYNRRDTDSDYNANRDDMLRILDERPAEDVPELWVSREDGGWADAWGQEPTWRVLDGWGVWEGRGSWRIPSRLAVVLALKPGDCRRVTTAEYERYFEPVLDLDPSERCAALERMVP